MLDDHQRLPFALLRKLVQEEEVVLLPEIRGVDVDFVLQIADQVVSIELVWNSTV